MIVEVVPNEARTDPSTAFSLVMLANTPGGGAYTLSELQKFCADAGFVATRRIQLPSQGQGRSSGGWRSTLVMTYPQQPKVIDKEKYQAW